VNGGGPISVATRGAACWAMRETSRSLASAIVLGLASRLLIVGPRAARPPSTTIRSRSRCPARVARAHGAAHFIGAALGCTAASTP
jgi:hypothetical protein